MAESSVSPLDEVRHVLFGNEREEIAELRAQIGEVAALRAQVEEMTGLRSQIEHLSALVERLEELVLTEPNRANAVGEVLVAAVGSPKERPGELGSAMRSEIEHAVAESARVDSVVLAEALYPVMGPAMRKMIAALFTSDGAKPGDSFVVDQVLLMERESGLLLAAVHRNPDNAENADIVSGMLDAIRLFVQDAFDKNEHDGLSNLRVGDTSVLVEWGPKAVLASVVHGVPTDEYRSTSALTLELFHQRHGHDLDSFNGDVSVFDPALPALVELRETGEPDAPKPNYKLIGATLVLVVLVVLVLVWLL